MPSSKNKVQPQKNSHEHELDPTGVYQLANGTWAYRFCKSVNGKNVYKRASTDQNGNPLLTQRDAILAREAAMLEAQGVFAPVVSSMGIVYRPSATLEEVYEDYCANGRGDRSHNTIKRQETLHIIADGVRLFQQAAQRLRPEEIEYRAGAELDVVVIREADQLVRSLVGKTDAVVAGDALEGAAGIAGGLILYSGDAFSCLRALGLHHAHGASIDKQGVVHLAGAGGELPNSHAGGGSQVERIHVLNDPPRLLQLFVDDKPRALLG